MTTKEKIIRQIEAAKILEDEIYPIQQDANKLQHIVSLLFDQFFSEEIDNIQESRERIFVRFENAQLLFKILTDYSLKLKEALDDLELIATEKA